ncbi:WGR domain-containing protein [Ancylobacter vacuolatus]|uniref:DNA-binding WGR domain protein n=1 Tax=Ancylobacter vacuolatus TaxID=223389 RepID=A0ABU0DK53_9HYPH|nr:WGR domain-containing protein [Ancylobacter vacuolatus]MDQ0348818.1 putative DNA-binding WGR domain protein [Ancylobacter vacuolatus]
MSTIPNASFHLRRIVPARNMARFYVACVEPSLLPGCSLRRSWGRIGAPGRTRIDLFDASANAVEALARLRRQKLRRGYVEVGDVVTPAADTTVLVDRPQEPNPL